MATDVSLACGRRWSLRAATADLHARVETIVADADMFASRERYLAWLEASHAARAGIERTLEANDAADIFPAWPRRRVATILEADIADLGGQPAALTDTNSAGFSSRPEVLGALYVLEGSALGARLLVKSAAALDMTDRFGARHLHHQASDRDAWPDFLAILDGARLDAAGEAACAQAASRAFGIFRAALSRAAAGADA